MVPALLILLLSQEDLLRFNGPSLFWCSDLDNSFFHSSNSLEFSLFQRLDSSRSSRLEKSPLTVFLLARYLGCFFALAQLCSLDSCR